MNNRVIRQENYGRVMQDLKKGKIVKNEGIYLV